MSKLVPGQWVAVYRNLHKDCFSVQLNGKVIAHVEHIMLSNVKFKVGEKGRERVLREKRKNVHAKIYGTIREQTFDLTKVEWPKAYYNPYKYETFVDENHEPIYEAEIVFMSNGKNIQYKKQEYEEETL